MTKMARLLIIITAILVAAALIFGLTAGISGKAVKGGTVVKLKIGSSYELKSISEAVASAGVNGNILESSLTTAEVEMPAMSDQKLEQVSGKILEKVKSVYPSAVIEYAEHYDKNGLSLGTAGFIYAAIGFIVLSFVYGLIRFGWKHSLIAVLTSVVACAATVSICILLSSIAKFSTYIFGIFAGTMILTYLYTVVLYNDYLEYGNAKIQPFIPCMVAVISILVAVMSGTSVAVIMFPAVVGSVASYLSVFYIAPSFWSLEAKKAN